MTVKDLECGDEHSEQKRTKWPGGLIVTGSTGIPQLKNKADAVAFPTIHRDEDRLAKVPPEIILQFEGGGENTVNALRKLKLSNDITLIQINTALFILTNQF